MHEGSGERPRGSATPPGRVTKGPFVDRCSAGKHAWCRCKRSARFPYCDGAHRSGDGVGGVAETPLKVVFDEARTVIWCACGQTGNPPYCDGTHSNL